MKVVRKYIKHQCDNSGTCNLIFPTVEFNCNQLPQPQNVMGHLPEIVYAPVELASRKCVTKTYLATTNSNIVSSSDLIANVTTQVPVPATPDPSIPITLATEQMLVYQQLIKLISLGPLQSKIVVETLQLLGHQLLLNL